MKIIEVLLIDVREGEEEELEVEVLDPTLEVVQEMEGAQAGPEVPVESKPAGVEGEVEQETGAWAGPEVPKESQQS